MAIGCFKQRAHQSKPAHTWKSPKLRSCGHPAVLKVSNQDVDGAEKGSGPRLPGKFILISSKGACLRQPGGFSLSSRFVLLETRSPVAHF